MLKINLLPPYINQASKIRTAWTLLAAVLALELVGLTLFQASRIGEEHAKLTEVEQKETEVKAVQKTAQDAVNKRAEVKPIKDKTDFINALLAYNKVRPNLYDHVASYIYHEVWISGMQAEQNVLTMPASAKSISGVGRFLLFMQNNPDFTKVQISSVPGWPPGTAGVEAGAIDVGGGASTGGRGGGYGGPGGPPGGPPGGGYSAPPGGGSSGGAPPGAGGPPGGGAPGYGGPPIFGGGADAGGGAPGLMSPPTPGLDNGAITSGGAPIPYSSAFTQVKPLPTYFGFTVTGVLAKPIERPSYLGVGAEGDTGGSYGAGTGGYGTGGPSYGPPGGPGGPPGGPGGSGGPAGSGSGRGG